MKKMSDIQQFINSSDELRKLLLRCPYHVLSNSKLESYKKGEFNLYQSEIYPYVWILMEGEVEIYLFDDNDRFLRLALYKPGDLIGEHEIFELKPFSSSVRSLSDVVVLKLTRDDFFSWLAQDSDFARSLIVNLTQQLYQLNSIKALVLWYGYGE